MVGLIGPGLAATAHAGAFGGFARDGKSYLDGADRVCKPISGAGAPVCRKASKDEVTRLGFRMGTPQRGSTATIVAEASGSALKLKDARSKVLLVNAPNNPTGWTLTRDEQQAILDHCRRPGPHTTACWVLDLLLGGE